MAHNESFTCEIWLDDVKFERHEFESAEGAEKAALEAEQKGLECSVWNTVVAYPICPPDLYEINAKEQFKARQERIQIANAAFEQELKDAGLWDQDLPF